MEILIDVEKLYKEENEETAKIANIDKYIKKALSIAGEGNSIILTGQGPIWLYLKLAHALHGKAIKLIYRSPVTKDLIIFDHSPF